MIPALSIATTDHSPPPPDAYQPHRRRQRQQRNMRRSPWTTSFLLLLLWCSGFGSLLSSTSPATALVAAAASTNEATEGENSNPVGKSSVISEDHENKQSGLYPQSRRSGRTLTMVMNCLSFMGDKVAKLQAWCYATLLALVRRTQHRNDSDPEDDHSCLLYTSPSPRDTQ